MSFVIASLDGRALLELRVTLRRGAEPSTFEAVLTGDAPAVGAPVVLRVADAGTARELRQFQVTRVENLGDGRSRVHGADARHEWAQRPVRARLNPAGGDGTAQAQALPLSAVLARLFALAGLNDAPGAPALVPRNVVCDGSLADAIELACARCGLTLGVNDAGAVLLEPAGETFAPDAARLIAAADSGRAGPAAVIGGPALELTRVTDWQAVIPGDGSAGFPAGEFHDLGRALTAWGIAETQARRAALHEGGFDGLVPATSPNGAARLELLRRHAFRLCRARGFAGPWLPVGGVNDDGTLSPPRLEAAMPRPRGFAPATATGDNFDAGGFAPARDGFELDCERGLVRVQHPPYAVSGGDATLQSRVLAGPPRLRLTIARPGALPPLQVGQGAALHAPHLVAVYDDGVMLNRAALEHGARALLPPPGPRAEYLLAGADGALAIGGRVRVEIAADADGLRTRIVDAPPVPPPESAVESAGAAGDAVAPVPGGPHQPINAFRAGPLILRASGTTPETESAVAARAVARDPRTNNLQLDSFGPLAFPFHLDSLDPARHGRWFFVAGVESVADGRLRVNAGAEIAGKLTVGGLIDPTGLELTPQGSNPGAVAASTLWLDSGDGNRAKIGSNKLAYTSEAGEANTASNVGTGASVFKEKSGVDLKFRRIAGGLNINVAQNTNDITVALSGAVGVSNGGTGQTTEDGAIDAFLGAATARTPDKDSRLAARTGSGQGGYSTVENVLKALRTLTQKTSVIRTDRFLITDESASGAPKYVTLDDLHPNGQAYVMESVEYTGSGSSGKTVTLTGINRAHLLVFFNQSNTGSIWVYLAVPFGATGTVTARALADGSRVTSLSLDAPSAGTSQVLTINNTLSNFNASSNTYRLWVVGTPI
ncbi:MAG: hypothetical protein KJ044_03375 [Planctomycetes bacterium]|nr:hypothetical protein [Planctomycetota bacterium]